MNCKGSANTMREEKSSPVPPPNGHQSEYIDSAQPPHQTEHVNDPIVIPEKASIEQLTISEIQMFNESLIKLLVMLYQVVSSLVLQ